VEKLLEEDQQRVIIKNLRRYRISEKRYSILDAGCWMLDTGYSMLDAGCSMLDTRYWMLDTGCWMLDTG
jgi:hypothetical protein